MESTIARKARLCVALGLFACGQEAVSPHHDGGAAMETVVETPVDVHGAIREIFMQGQTQSRVRLDELSLTSSSFGLGALSELRGEITIVEGESWLAYPDGPEDVDVEVTTDSDEGAALLVVADVEAWLSLPIDAEVSYQELGAYVSTRAEAAGWPNRGPLPFLIEGPVRSLRWHVVDGTRVPEAEWSREAVQETAFRETLDQGDVRCIGFYAPDQQLVFIPPGETVHVHMVDESRQVSGHVEDAVILPGAVLKLPIHAP